jgi:hypothetical protein
MGPYLEHVVEEVFAGLDVLRFSEYHGQEVDDQHIELLIQVINLRQEAVVVVFFKNRFPVLMDAHLRQKCRCKTPQSLPCRGVFLELFDIFYY